MRGEGRKKDEVAQLKSGRGQGRHEEGTMEGRRERKPHTWVLLPESRDVATMSCRGASRGWKQTMPKVSTEPDLAQASGRTLNIHGR